jgi:hypothetical protein
MLYQWSKVKSYFYETGDSKGQSNQNTANQLPQQPSRGGIEQQFAEN